MLRRILARSLVISQGSAGHPMWEDLASCVSSPLLLGVVPSDSVLQGSEFNLCATSHTLPNHSVSCELLSEGLPGTWGFAPFSWPESSDSGDVLPAGSPPLSDSDVDSF